MTKTTYVCNMCRREYTDRAQAYENLFAYYFNSGFKPQRYELWDINANCDTHICKTCIDTIVEQSINLTSPKS